MFLLFPQSYTHLQQQIISEVVPRVEITSLLTSFSLIYNNLRMDIHEPEWEGFESFNDENKIVFRKQESREQILYEEPQGEKEEEKITILSKKLTFRSKNKRKASFVTNFPSNPSRKNNNHIELTTTLPQRTVIAQRVKRALVFEKKEEGIPIFHEIQYKALQGQLIYKSQPLATAEQYLQRNIRKESPSLPLNGDELRFESKFQSGNLEQVARIGNEYHLYMAVDTNTRGHRQWFYFSVISPQNKKVKMIVHSFRKKMSLFQIGMKPYGKRKQEGQGQWKPIGNNIRYGRDADRGKRINNQKRVEFCLSFEIELQKNEEFCIASCIPYSYTFLRERLRLFTSYTASKVQIREDILCKTLTGLQVPLITINGQAITKQHRYLIINARTHPGESSASWVLDGLLKEIISSHILQQLLIEFKVVMKIVPMLNVQGVCMGNYRTGTMGMDFNRLFLTGSPDLFPQINALKKIVEECKARGKVDLFFDLHGHSILPGCFMYGPDPVFAPKTALGPLMRQMRKSRYFMRDHCVQGVDSNKAETSRIYFQVQEGIFALTCENSLGLYCKNGQKGREMQFEAKDWQQFGKQLIGIILNIYDEYNCEEREVLQERSALEQAMSLIRSAEEEEFVWQKSKTDNGKVEQQMRLLQELQLQEIDLPRQLTISQDHAPEQTMSLNDSDASSQDLSIHKQQQLIKMVRKTLAKHAPPVPIQLSLSNAALSPNRHDPKTTLSCSRGKFINNFKEIRFGVEDSTINDWYNRKRLFSIPKHLKNDRQGQSYLIRKKQSHLSNTELAAEPVELTKRVRTEEREMRRSSFDRFSAKEFVTRQKVLLENLLMKKL